MKRMVNPLFLLVFALAFLMQANAAYASEPIIGEWQMSDGQIVIFYSNHRASDPATSWYREGREVNNYGIRWNNGSEGNLILTDNNNSFRVDGPSGRILEGKRVATYGRYYNSGPSKHSTRRSYTGPDRTETYSHNSVVGTWRWSDGETITCYSNGKMTNGSWTLIDRNDGRYRFHWINSGSMIMTLSSNGNRMEGENPTTGRTMWAERISSSTSYNDNNNSGSRSYASFLGERIRRDRSRADDLLESDSISVPSNERWRIVSASCSGNGFVLVHNGKTYKHFTSESQSIDYHIPTGTYLIYPILKSNQDHAKVTIKVEKTSNGYNNGRIRNPIRRR